MNWWNRRWFQSLPPLVIAGLVMIVFVAAQKPGTHHRTPSPNEFSFLRESDQTIAKLNSAFEKSWKEAEISPAEPATDLDVYRRLSLALHGTIPSLEELRQFEQDQQPQKIERWLLGMLEDPRFSDYFAARFGRFLIGAEDGQFIVFRRDRFRAWMSQELKKNTPYDELVRQMMSSRGLWTGEPSTNYVTAAAADGTVDVNKLAGRTVRAFLGQRIDCAQCHNHPFAHWKQDEFEGIAACFGQVKITAVGVEDDQNKKFEVEDRKTLEMRTPPIAVPFQQDLLPQEGLPRERLTAWVTHRENRRFDRAITNRIWGLMFGRSWFEPVDDLPDPDENGPQDNNVLDLLATDFLQHDRQLKRLIFIIGTSRPFRLSSAHPAYETGEKTSQVDELWAAFPLVRLRPEQVIGAMLQGNSIRTIDQNSHLLTRTIRFFRETDFVKEYGDLGDEELLDRSGTIPQALLRMNGRFAQELIKANPINSAGRISQMAPDDEKCVDLCFLSVLTRHPTAEEKTHFTDQLKNLTGDARSNVVEDILWTLVNATEFSWNH